MLEGFPCQFQTVGIGKFAIFFQDIDAFALLGRIGNDSDVFIVFSRSTDHAGATNIDIFNSFCQGDARFGNRLLERIQVDYDQIDGGNAMIFHILDVGRIVTDGQNGTVDFRMKRLDTAIHHLWEARHIIDGNGLYPSIIKGNFGTTC